MVDKVVDLTIRIDIDGVFMDIHATDAIRGVIGIEEREEMLAIKVEQVEANIIRVEVLENDIETFG